MAAEIGVKVKIDGYAEFKKNMSDLSQQQKTLKSDLERVSSEWDKNTSAERKNADIKKSLAQQIDVQKQKVEQLEAALEQVEAKYGENSREANSWKEKLNQAKTELNNLNNELKEIPNGLQQFGDNLQEAGGKITALGEGIKGVGTTLTAGLTAPLAAVGAAAVAAFTSYDSGADTIIAKTGATGDALNEMKGIMEDLASSMPNDFNEIGAAVGEVNTRFGLMGDDLSKVSEAFLQFSRLNDTDVSGSIDKVQSSMVAFGLSGNDAVTALDILNKAGQDTGISVDKLSADIMANSTTLKEMGYSYDEAAGFIANLNKNGIDSGTVMSGLRKALQNAAKEGKPLSEVLKEMEQDLKNADSSTEAMQRAMELFGNKAGPQLAKAISEGRISLDAASNAVQNYGGSVANTFNEIQSPTDQLKTVFNELQIVGADIGTTLLEMAVPALEKLSEVLHTIRDAWASLSPEQQQAIVTIGLAVAAIGPLVTAIGTVVSAIGGAVSVVGGIVSAISAAGPVIASMGAAFAGLIAAIGPFVAIGAAVVAAGVLIYQNWDTIKAKAGELAETCKTKWDQFKQDTADSFNKAKEDISNAMQTARSFVEENLGAIATATANKLSEVRQKWEENGGGIRGAVQTAMDEAKGLFDAAYNYINDITGGKLSELVQAAQNKLNELRDAFNEKLEAAKKIVQDGVDFIKGLFDFEWSLPPLKLPHFSVQGQFSVNPPSVPTFGIEWYAKAMQGGVILDSPTIFGMMGNSLLGAGESGPEVVVGASSLYGMIKDAVSSSTIDYGGVNINVYATENQSVRELAEEIANIINDGIESKGAAWA